jgi:CBS domain-containing protein
MRSSEPTPAIASIRRIVDDTGRTIVQRGGVAPEEATVAGIMTRAVYCVRPDVGIDLLATLFLEHSVSGFPVVDPAGRPVGIVSKTDLLRYFHDHAGDLTSDRDEDEVLAELGGGFHAVRVMGASTRDIMMPIVFALAEDAPIARAAALMAGEGVHRLPILDGDGKVCGILSSLDIVRWLAVEAGYPVR